MTQDRNKDNTIAAMNATHQGEAKTMMVEKPGNTRIPSEQRGP